MRDLINKKTVSNTLHLLSEKGITVILTLITSILVIRYLGPAPFGVLSYAISIVALVLPFANLGYSTIVIKELVNDPENSPQILGSSAFASLISSWLCYLVLIVSSYFLLDSLTYSLVVILAFRILLNSFTSFDDYFQAKIKSKYSAIARSTSLTLTSLLKVVLILGSSTLLWFAVADVVQLVLMILLLAYFFFKKTDLSIKHWTIDKSTLKRIAHHSWPLLLSNAFIAINFKIDQIIIHDLLDNEQVGIYAAAAQLSEGWYFLPVAFLGSVFPLLIANAKQSASKVNENLKQLCSTFFYLALITSLLVLLTADWVLPWLLGESFMTSASVLKIHIWASVFNFIGRPVTKMLIIQGLTQYHLYMRFFAALVNIGLNYWLIPIYGIQGAAYATLISYAFGSFLGYGVFKETRPYFVIQLSGMVLPFKLIGKLFKVTT
ncbi:flippase [Reichenbachiella carrageenanivorans]|uniref:Flippase n=1 Tax=Reichenbachiella carrageenanivorans TaxID=2979869 RepID=A0ABY6D3D2_9BACT|nr:flippase [Reichenbachiella carrageenanivorans]UXX80409.1 flippase [Reichenbachiella carrageenanivorans]